MDDIPMTVDRYFYPFYHFMKSKGFEIETATYDKDGEEFACILIFKAGTDFKKLVNFMDLINKDINTGILLSSTDNSYSVGLQKDGTVIMTMDKKHHTAIICYIMANG